MAKRKTRKSIKWLIAKIKNGEKSGKKRREPAVYIWYTREGANGH